MDSKVDEFISKKKLRKEEQLQKQKDDFLISLGLWDKEYEQGTHNSREYPIYDGNVPTSKYYKKVPYDVSDEQYEELRKLCPQKRIPPINYVMIFKVVGIIILVITFIMGIQSGITMRTILGTQVGVGEISKFNFAVALRVWFLGFVIGLVIMGFGEIIRLLTEINSKKDN